MVWLSMARAVPLFLLLTGCATVTSQTALFPPSANRFGLEGVYLMKGDTGEGRIVVRKSSASTYEASLFAEKPAVQQVGAVEFSAVPLGGGDYVLQVSCFAQKQDEKSDWEAGTGFGYWILAAARARGDYWLGALLSGDDAKSLAAKYNQKADDKGIALTGLSPARAEAFFKDWDADLMATGGDAVLPILRPTGYHTPDGPDFDHPLACRDVPKG